MGVDLAIRPEGAMALDRSCPLLLTATMLACGFPRPDDPSREYTVIRLGEYMGSQYPNRDEANYKTVRCALIMGNLTKHIDDFDVSDYAVQDSSQVGALVGSHLLRAVDQLFAGTLPKRDRRPRKYCTLPVRSE